MDSSRPASSNGRLEASEKLKKRAFQAKDNEKNDNEDESDNEISEEKLPELNLSPARIRKNANVKNPQINTKSLASFTHSETGTRTTPSTKINSSNSKTSTPSNASIQKTSKLPPAAGAAKGQILRDNNGKKECRSKKTISTTATRRL